jgi:hypothetical protein
MLTICTTSPFFPLIINYYTSLLGKGYLFFVLYIFNNFDAYGLVFRVTGNIDLRAPLPNSYTNPTVRIPKNINTTQKPKVPTSYRLTVIGYNTNNSRSNTKNSIATK